jgi:hypothetical protein
MTDFSDAQAFWVRYDRFVKPASSPLFGVRDMTLPVENPCPECSFGPDAALARRDFLRISAYSAAVATSVTGLGAAARAAETPKAPAKPKPAEDLIRELFSELSEDQKKKFVLDYDHGSNGGKALPTRLGMYNGPIQGKKIADVYTKTQQELVERIFKAITSGDEGYHVLSRAKTWDNSQEFSAISAVLFGNPLGKDKFSFVFAGHHITVRCDGNSEEGAAFGGPMYYGHTPNGYSDKNVFFYQTKRVLSVFDALDEKQRKIAQVSGSPGEQAASIKFRKPADPKPGLCLAEMSADQRELVQKVMRDLISPFRQEDADEVMDIVKANGGPEKQYLAFYEDTKMNDKQPWHFWRIEGPGFVWNFRVLPHVHTYVNISSKL